MTLQYAMEQQFTPQEAEEILHAAVRRSLEQPIGTPSESISQERLTLMASELGIDSALLGRILNERQQGARLQEAQQSLEQQRALFIEQRRLEFFQHLVPFAIINGILVWLNLRFSSGFLWSLFPVLVWGIGLILHGADVLPARGALFEEKFDRWRKKRERRSKRPEE